LLLSHTKGKKDLKTSDRQVREVSEVFADYVRNNADIEKPLDPSLLDITLKLDMCR
jgi:hypothetical protein